MPDIGDDIDTESDRINALQHQFGEDGYHGWLSTLTWNIRNRYSAHPDGVIEASAVRLLVEGFLAEVVALTAARDEWRARAEGAEAALDAVLDDFKVVQVDSVGPGVGQRRETWAAKDRIRTVIRERGARRG